MNDFEPKKPSGENQDFVTRDLENLEKQIAFIKAIDALKSVQRKTYLLDQSRFENSAEHSWAVSTLVLVLEEYAPTGVEIFKVVKMLLLHDIVEIDAGDTLLYDEAGTASKRERETAAADRLFGLLPNEQAMQFRDIWEEFEAEESAEAIFAAGLDRLIPLIHNIATEGRAWRELGVRYDQIMQKNAKIEKANPVLWAYIKKQIDALFAPQFDVLK